MNENNPHQIKRNGLGWLQLLFPIVLIGAGILIWQLIYKMPSNVSYTEYERDLKEKTLTEVVLVQNEQVPTGTVRYQLKGDTKTVYQVAVPDVTVEQKKFAEKELAYQFKDVPQENYFLTTILPLLIIGVMMFIFLSSMTMRMNMATQDPAMRDFTKNKARKYDPDKNDIRFGNVAGLHEEKEELEEIVDFLKKPDKYINMGARIPKGIILIGPPGTGKTLLAKAVAGEAGVPFFSISGSDFVEMFVGVGASRVRELFNEAKKDAPCIIFIDEIDAVARIRGSGLGGGHDEREQTLNQILVEMDGFTTNQGIIVMAATNRADILDPAILRPGRFDRKVAVGRPDVRGREEILNVHARNKKLGDDVDLQRIAAVTPGFTGADLENLLNEAAILAARENRAYINQKDIDQSLVKVGIGQEKKSKIISEKEKRITAYHEMGHAILFEALPDVGPVHTISVIPTGLGAAGYTMPVPEQDEMFKTRRQMLSEIMVSMGGRIAEEIVLNDITTGASQDIKEATDTARAMVMKYGMSEKIGFINYEQGEDQVFMGRDLGHMKTYGNDSVNTIESEVKEIIDMCYAEAKRILMEKVDVLHRGAELLIEKEKIGQAEFEAIYYGKAETSEAAVKEEQT